MTDLTALTLDEARKGLAEKKFTSVELTKAHLGAMEAARPLNAYVLETPEKALEMAAASDARRAKGEAGRLEGIPLGIKDLFATKGAHTQAASHILDGFKPKYESTVTQNLWNDGAVMLGKLNMDEFAMGSSNESSAFGPVVSPWRRAGDAAPLTPGGSSGGSAAADPSPIALSAASAHATSVILHAGYIITDPSKRCFNVRSARCMCMCGGSNCYFHSYRTAVGRPLARPVSPKY